MYIVTTAQMQATERAAHASGLSYAQMMENAGRTIAQALETEFALAEFSVLVLVGPGNNGGDGLVVARYVAQAGARVAVYVWQRRNLENDPNWQALDNMPVQRILSHDDADGSQLSQWLQQAHVLVDALLGTGASRPIEGTLAMLLERTTEILSARRAVQNSLLIEPACPYPKLTMISKIEGLTGLNPVNPFVVAIDLPSGLHSDTGMADSHTLPADLTITLAAVKMGHILKDGVRVTGRLMVGDIQLTAVHYPSDVTLKMVTAIEVAAMLPPRPNTAHKGTFGKVIIVAGSVNYTGAAILAGQAAWRSGVGWVTMACPQTIYPILATSLVAATYLPLPDEQGHIASTAVPYVAQNLERATALLIGPGLTQAETTATFLQNLLSQNNLPPLIIDADGLNILAKKGLLEQAKLPPNCILTPHLGEMSRLMGVPLAQVEAERLACATEMAVKWQQVVLLKGAYTIVAAPDGRVMVEPFANSALAKAGSGDVLAGTIAGLRAQGVPAFESAVAGAYLHGLAGALARQKLGAASVMAGDVVDGLPLALSQII